MLSLQNVYKDYLGGENVVHALKHVTLNFGESDFVAILGASGCGKTTLLNIIGGLDRYTSGDLLIDGKSTKDFGDSDWDSYRNNTIGFVFQSYNLIPHITVLANVEIALTLSGVDQAERKRRAKEALDSVGLIEQINKKPNQLSGGQMQRVAIARALVNNPKILLADEPTGALDTQTSIQIMDILKEIAKTKLVVMVTHNEEIADNYATRVISLRDGVVVGDNKPIRTDANEGTAVKYSGGKNTSMSFMTAISLSFNNLKTKKLRTILVSIAGSIGIIGIALVLAISSGMTAFVNDMSQGALADFPITVSNGTTFSVGVGSGGLLSNGGRIEYPSGDIIYSENPMPTGGHTNVITKEYIDYLTGLDAKLYTTVSYSYGMNLNALYLMSNNAYKLLPKAGGGGMAALMSSSSFYELPDNEEFLLKQYDLLGNGKYPSNANEAVLVVDSSNNISPSVLASFGFDQKEEYGFDEFLGKTFKIIENDLYYREIDGIFYEGSTQTDYAEMYEKSNIELKIVGIMRIKENAASSMLSDGIGYTPALANMMRENAANSKIVAAQRAENESGSNIKVLEGNEFSTNASEKDAYLRQIGLIETPNGINIYPVSFDAKEEIKKFLSEYNDGKSENEKIIYTDLAGMVFSAMDTMINTIAVVLAAVAGISLVVSSLMIGIITYVSVVERTKEIGILRSIGARKKDISRVFNAETLIIGFAAGVIGIATTLLLSIPVNIIVENLVGVTNIAALPFLYGVILIAVSMGLTFVAGLIPSRIAAKKDPVAALRSE